MKLLPGSVELLPKLADSARRKVELPGDLASGATHGQGLGDAAIPLGLRVEPGGEVNSEGDLVGDGGSGVFDDGLQPLAGFLMEAV